MLRLLCRYLLILSALGFLDCCSMTFDNRWFPEYLKPFPRYGDYFCHFRVQPLITRANSAVGNPQEMSIPDLWGKYTEGGLARAAVLAGITDDVILRSDLLISDIPWTRQGFIDSQGVAFFYEQFLGCARDFEFALGGSFLFLNIVSRVSAEPERKTNSDGFTNLLNETNGKINDLLGITSSFYKRVVPGDLDIYLRMGRILNYKYKFRRIDVGGKFGVIFPTSLKNDFSNAAFVPAGGSHFGVYVDVESEFELKEDWTLGFMARAIKRIAQNQTIRMPVGTEPWTFGAATGTAWIDPGATIVANLYFSLDNLREGLGAKVYYTGVAHFGDDIQPVCYDSKARVNIDSYRDITSWGIEHITVACCYDISRFRADWAGKPLITLQWDIPVEFVIAKNSPRTNCISLMIEADF